LDAIAASVEAGTLATTDSSHIVERKPQLSSPFLQLKSPLKRGTNDEHKQEADDVNVAKRPPKANSITDAWKDAMESNL
jgi:hypothetical protein